MVTWFIDHPFDSNDDIPVSQVLMVYDHVLTFDKEVSYSTGCCLKHQLINGNRSTGSGRQCQIGIFMQLIAKQLGPTRSDSDGASQSVYSCSIAMSCLHWLCMLRSSIHVASISYCPCQLAGSWLSVRVSSIILHPEAHGINSWSHFSY
jgi:hypothetical protein